MPERKRPQKRNPNWKDSTVNDRQSKRLGDIALVVRAAGWNNLSQMLTAMKKGEVLPPLNPNASVRLDGNSSKESTKLIDIGG